MKHKISMTRLSPLSNETVVEQEALTYPLILKSPTTERQPFTPTTRATSVTAAISSSSKVLTPSLQTPHAAHA